MLGTRLAETLAKQRPRVLEMGGTEIKLSSARLVHWSEGKVLHKELWSGRKFLVGVYIKHNSGVIVLIRELIPAISFSHFP